MTKLFLKTLNQFYYVKMVGSAPKDFAEMVGIGVQLEEGVWEGRLVKESVPASSSKKKEEEVSMVKGRPQQKYMAYQQVAAITPATNAIQQPLYQPQQPYQQQQPRQQASRTWFDLIPMKYVELLPSLLKGNYVQTRPPPPMPKKLPAGFRADLSCVFHQGASGHDVERCYALRNAV
jgi:hypothetical protein